jgi:hypothetical protein
MSAFEFFFSFYGLLLGLSLAAIATGLATAIQHRKSVRIGWRAPLLAIFVALDIASFWDSAWTNFRLLPFSYGLLVAGLVIALVYFVAASLVFPHRIEDGASLDDHFAANKRPVLLLLIVANLLNVAVLLAVNLDRPGGMTIMKTYAVTMALYLALVGAAAFAKGPRLFATMIGLHTAIYLAIAVYSVVAPTAPVDEDGRVNVRGPAPASAPR